MKTRVAVVMVMCTAIAALFGGCAWSIGECKERQTVNQPTQGQQLIDLKKAKDQGAISEEEYNTQRSRVLGQ